MEDKRLDQYMKTHKKSETFSDMMIRLIRESGLDEAEVYKRARIDRRLFSKIRSDKDYHPTLHTVVALALALHMTNANAKVLIKSAGYILSSRSDFALLIRYCFENTIYNIDAVNILLHEKGLPTLN
jgi:predicted transcriptional regulator